MNAQHDMAYTAATIQAVAELIAKHDDASETIGMAALLIRDLAVRIQEMPCAPVSAEVPA